MSIKNFIHHNLKTIFSNFICWEIIKNFVIFKIIYQFFLGIWLSDFLNYWLILYQSVLLEILNNFGKVIHLERGSAYCHISSLACVLESKGIVFFFSSELVFYFLLFMKSRSHMIEGSRNSFIVCFKSKNAV